ncbi:hypothetical protein DM02DRAFT_664508 [Periconia macrospinosa]|uniref:Azaphilone pigments biosynthesis cluster protein L N-terminal domain-containing protein n=1 Tax=Periconia macrospinosa TaxID=97972 RepID=A0A2V1CYX6_9PLEO|nr:hypothetical protein DM02DRAFT_664508 [Periconia macrospinosa]
MATAIGITSGVIMLATYTFDSSVSLYQTFKGFQSSKREIRQLQDELHALRSVTQLLKEGYREDATLLEALTLPLLQCRDAFTDFEHAIVDYFVGAPSQFILRSLSIALTNAKVTVSEQELSL